MVNICDETGLTLPDCNCDDCTSEMLNLIKNAILALNDSLDSEILSQLQELTNNFANYYNKEQTISLIESSGGVHFEEVETLPDDPQADVIYLVPIEDGEGNCNYEKWFFFNNKWESMNCGGDTSVIRLNFITDCGEESFTYMDSGTFPMFADVCPDGAEDPNITFNGWYCALDDETLYAEGSAIPSGFFEDAPCTALEANTTTENYMVFMDVDGVGEEGMTETYPAVFPNYSDLFIVTTPLGEDEEYWWEYSYGGTGSVEPGTLYAEGDTIPIEFYEYDGGSSQDPSLSPHFIGVIREKRTVGIHFSGSEEPEIMPMAIYADGVQIDTVEVENDVNYTYSIYDGAVFDAQPLEWVNDATAFKQVTTLGGLDFVDIMYDPADVDAMPPLIMGVRLDLTVERATTQEELDAQMAEILNGVTATDGNGNTLEVTIDGFDGTWVHEQSVEYVATDSDGNETRIMNAVITVVSGR